jgi:hypothetical protein
MYYKDVDWDGWKALIESIGQSIDGNIMTGKNEWDRWYKLTYGKTPEQVQADFFPEKSVEDVTNMIYAIGVFKAIYDAYSIETVRGYLLPFLY